MSDHILPICSSNPACPSRSLREWFALIALFSLAPLFSPEISADEATARGKAIFQKQCASCHGESGQGSTEGYAEPLIGDASIKELAKIISDTMPEEDPESCVGKDALEVATYVHESFYSEAAQVRNRPPQVQFARLTSNQVHQSLADLYQHFYGQTWLQEGHGLTGLYFDSGRWDKKKKKLERVDPVIDFDFGRGPPVEGVSEKEFYLYWSGALKVEHTGRYQIVVHSTCSMKLSFGNTRHTLIDNHVQSEGKTEFRRTLNLVAGRHYPIELEFKQRKRKTELPPAEISLRWVPPGGEESVIPTEYLLPKGAASTFALQTKLPPDDRSYGYDRGTQIDRQWDEAITRAAFEFGEIAVQDMWPNYRRRHRGDSDENRGRLRAFLTELVSLAFRQPMDEATQATYIDRQLEAEEDDQTAIRRVCLLTIKSPRFLYPDLPNHVSESRRIANRLALILYDSLPTDEWLLKEISKDNFRVKEDGSTDAVRRIAQRMLKDPRLHGKAMGMFFEWFGIDPAEEIVKEPEQFAGFDKTLLADLRRSFESTVADVFWSNESDYRELFLSKRNYTSKRLYDFYGESWNAEETFQPHQMVKSVESDRHSGLLTHPLLMSRLGYFETSSPIHRGVFLTRHVLGRTLRPPQAAFTPFDPDLHPKLTTRERVTLQTSEENCQVCHARINAVGFALENYDAAGRFRTNEGERPIDASGSYVTRLGETVEFSGPADLAKFLSEHEDAHRAFVERVFEHFVKQPIAAFGEGTADELVQRFRASKLNMRNLIVEIAVLVATQSSEIEEGHREST